MRLSIRSAALGLAVALVACAQEAVPASDAPAVASATGALACDEYLDLARACVRKNRFTAHQTTDIDALHQALRELVAGNAVRIDPADVWTSAARWAHGKTRERQGNAEESDRPSPTVVCKRGIDQLPVDCQ